METKTTEYHTKTLKSPRKESVNSSIIIIPDVSKTTLKSKNFLENMYNKLPDGDYDISKKDFGSEYRQTKTTPSKNEINVVSKPAQRRSMRLKSQAFDTSFLNLSDCKNTVESESAGNLETDILNNVGDKNISHNSNTIKIDNDKTRAEKRKYSSQESDEDFLGSINREDTAAMLLDTDIDNNISKRQKTNFEQPENLLNSSPIKRGSYVKETERNSHVIHSETCNMRLEKNIKISEAIIENSKESFLRKTRSLEMADNVSSSETLQTNDNTKDIKSSNVILNNSTTAARNNVGILKYFKAQNKQSDKEANCKDSPKIQEGVVQNTEFISDSVMSNNQQNSVGIPKKQGRSRSPLTVQHIDKTEKPNNQQNSLHIPVKRGRGRPQLTGQRMDNIEKSKNLPLTVQHIDETEEPNNQQSSVGITEKRGRGRPPLTVQHIDETKEPNNQQNSAQIPEKRGRGRPLSSVKRITKTNVSKKPRIKKYTKISNLTKEQIKNVGTRKIPKDRLDDVLNMIDDDDHPIWDDRNTSCNPYIFNHWNPRNLHSDQNIKIKYARQFLLRRDWVSLSKVLGLFTTNARNYYPLIAKYATLLLAHTDKDQFSKLIQFLTKCNDSSAVMKTCTKMPIGDAE